MAEAKTKHRSVLRGTALFGLFAATIVLANCEEPLTGGPSAPEPPIKTAPYRSADLDELQERWAVLPLVTGPAVPAHAQSERRRAGATDGFSGLEAYYTFSEARDYGACVTFTANITYPEIPDYPAKAHVIDCVGEPARGNPVDGLFHAARICQGGYSGPAGNLEWTRGFEIIYRAGDFQPKLGPHPADDPLEGASSLYVHTSVQEQPGGTRHEFHIRWHVHHPGFPEIPTNWAAYGGYVTEEFSFDFYLFGFNDIDQESERLHWSIDHSEGVAEIGEHDWSAVVDFRVRCDSLAAEGSTDGSK